MKRQLNNKGVTLTEMIVSFALLAIFLVAVTIVMTYAVRNYYEVRRVMSSYSVADLVLDEIKNDINTMQIAEHEVNNAPYGSGYVKLRNDSGVGVTGTAGTEISGNTIEFVASNKKYATYVEQIDAAGYKGKMIRSAKLTKNLTDADGALPSGYLTVRYYTAYTAEETTSLKDYYADIARADSTILDSTKGIAGVAAGDKIVRDCEERLPTDMYEKFTVKLTFSVKPVAETVNGVSMLRVKSVNAHVDVYQDGDLKYVKDRDIAIQNPVYYNNEKTLYSELP